MQKNTSASSRSSSRSSRAGVSLSSRALRSGEAGRLASREAGVARLSRAGGEGVVATRRVPRDARKAPVPRNPVETRRKLVDATLHLMLRQGFAATKVEEICAEAGVTKGGFFHYFENKEAIGRAALECFAEIGTEIYSAAWEDPSLDPLEQLHRHIDIMIAMARGAKDAPVVCMIGMLSQELSATNSHIRTICCKHLTTWSDRIEKMLAAAKKIHPPKVDFDPASVAWMLNSLWQGSMLIAKTRQRQDMIVSNLRHGRAYVDSLFFGAPARVPAAVVRSKRRVKAA